MLTLIIKGNASQARHAALDRGICLLSVENSPKHPECICRVSVAQRDKVAAWFAEAPYRAPYPVGALLYWQE